MKACLKNKKKYVLKSIHFAANILDPVYNGINLTNDEQALGTAYIDKKSIDICPKDSVEVMTQLAEYRCKERFFNNSYVFKSNYFGNFTSLSITITYILVILYCNMYEV